MLTRLGPPPTSFWRPCCGTAELSFLKHHHGVLPAQPLTPILEKNRERPISKPMGYPKNVTKEYRGETAGPKDLQAEGQASSLGYETRP